MQQERGYLDSGGHFIPEGIFQDLAQNSGVDLQADLIFRSSLTPEVKVDLLALQQGKPGAKTGPGFSWLLELLQPEFEVNFMGRQYTVSPYGRPKQTNYGPALAAVGVVGAAFIGYKAYKYLNKKR